MNFQVRNYVELESPCILLNSVRRYSANCPPANPANSHAAGGMSSVVDSFSRGRRASMAVPTDRDRLSLMNVLVMRRRLSDQVRE